MVIPDFCYGNQTVMLRLPDCCYDHRTTVMSGKNEDLAVQNISRREPQEH